MSAATTAGIAAAMPPELLDLLRAFIEHAPNPGDERNNDFVPCGLLDVTRRIVAGTLTAADVVQLAAAVRENLAARQDMEAADEAREAAEARSMAADKAMRDILPVETGFVVYGAKGGAS